VSAGAKIELDGCAEDAQCPTNVGQIATAFSAATQRVAEMVSAIGKIRALELLN
jgi:hypothetical protein